VLGKQAAGALPTACLSETGILSFLSAWPKSGEHALPGLAVSCSVLGLKMFLTALAACCWCGDSSQDSLDDIFYFFLFLFSTSQLWQIQIFYSLSKLFHKEEFCPLLYTGLDMHHPEMKTSWWREQKKRGANALPSP